MVLNAEVEPVFDILTEFSKKARFKALTSYDKGFLTLDLIYHL